MNEIVTIAPWNPWPLAIPILIAVGGVVLSSYGTRRRSKPMRELGTAIFLLSALTTAWMFFTMPPAWDQGRREEALTAIGYTSPTFSGEQVVSDGEPAVVAFQAERDGERVRGVIRSVGGDQWEVSEIEE